MRIVLMIVLGLAGFGLLAMIGFTIASHVRIPELGIQEGRLLPCPDTPNCVSSEPGEPEGSAIDPLAFEGDPGDSWARARTAVEAVGGAIVSEEAGYLRATCASLLFRFVDDLELRLDVEAGVIHVRSASRTGHSDMGANRKRVERLRSEFTRTP